MIRIKKGAKPSVLSQNETNWTRALLNAAASYGSFKEIPDSEKKKLLSHYAHDDIKQVLFQNRKCAYCECIPDGSSLQVEHFEPKSLYPELAFHWENLLPSCGRCNQDKGGFDTRRYPIINPEREDPETLLEYQAYNPLIMIPVKGTGQEEKAGRTVDVCNLNRPELFHARADLLIALTEYLKGLEDSIHKIEDSDTLLKKEKRIRKLRNSLDTIHSLLCDKAHYAGFCRWFVRHQDTFSKAEKLAATV